MLGVTAAARDEIDRVLRSFREALAVTPSTPEADPRSAGLVRGRPLRGLSNLPRSSEPPEG
jgi:hypothetical protein